MKKIHFLVWLSFLAFAAVPPAPIFAESNSSGNAAIVMDEVVVTATRDREEISKVPASVSVITSEQIEKSGATTVVDVLDKLEGVHFRSYSSNPSQALIDMRGFGGDNPYGKTLILLDGRRLNRPDMSSVNWLQFPVSDIERIEVVRGANCVLYGDAAIAGVINIITKKGGGKPRATASVMAGSYGFHDERAAVTGSASGVSFAVTGENQKTFGYRERSKFASWGGGANVGYDLSEYLTLSAGASYNSTKFDLPGSLTKAEMEQNPRQYQPGHANDDAAEEYRNANLRAESVLGNLGRLNVDLFYGSKGIESNYESYWDPNRFNRYDIETIGVTPRYILEGPFAGHANKATLGVDYYRETLDLKKYSDRDRTQETHEVDLERESTGFYLRDEFSFLENLILAAGYRTERATVRGKQTTLSPFSVDFDTEKLHRGEAFEVGLTWLFSKKSKVFAKYATVYRYPFLDEQASYYVGGSFNTNIEKEKGESYEIGTEVFLRENLRVGLTLYRIDMVDEISADPITWALRNLDKTRHEGLEASVSWKLAKWFDLYGNFTYQEARFREGIFKDKEVPLVPNVMANAGMELYLPFAFVLRPEVRAASDSYLGNDYDNNAEKLKGYTVFNLFLFYRPEKSAVSAFLGVENVTDERYADWGIDRAPWLPAAYSPAPGTTFKGGVSLAY